MAGLNEPDWDTLVEGNARQARKRVSADLLVRDEDGRVLIVDPSYKDGWDLPGGMVEANETPRAAAAREVAEELGLIVPAGRLLLVDWVPPHGPWDDLLAMVFDGGTLAADRRAALRLADGELRDHRFVTPTDASVMLRPRVGERLARALAALASTTTSYVEHPG